MSHVCFGYWHFSNVFSADYIICSIITYTPWSNWYKSSYRGCKTRKLFMGWDRIFNSGRCTRKKYWQFEQIRKTATNISLITRVTTNPEITKIISVGTNKVKDIVRWSQNNRLTPMNKAGGNISHVINNIINSLHK